MSIVELELTVELFKLLELLELLETTELLLTLEELVTVFFEELDEVVLVLLPQPTKVTKLSNNNVFIFK